MSSNLYAINRETDCIACKTREDSNLSDTKELKCIKLALTEFSL